MGVYTVEVTAAIPQPSDISGVKTVAVTYTLTVIDDCEFTNFVDQPIPDVLYIISKPAKIQSLFFDDEKAILSGVPTYCGPRVYTTSPAYSFLSFVGDDVSV